MNLKTAFLAFRIVTIVIPFIKEMIDAVEGPGHGPDKKKAVLDALDKVLTKLNVSQMIRSFIGEIASWLIDTIVMIRHLTGVWEHSSTATTKTTKPATGGD